MQILSNYIQIANNCHDSDHDSDATCLPPCTYLLVPMAPQASELEVMGDALVDTTAENSQINELGSTPSDLGR